VALIDKGIAAIEGRRDTSARAAKVRLLTAKGELLSSFGRGSAAMEACQAALVLTTVEAVEADLPWPNPVRDAVILPREAGRALACKASIYRDFARKALDDDARLAALEGAIAALILARELAGDGEAGIGTGSDLTAVLDAQFDHRALFETLLEAGHDDLAQEALEKVRNEGLRQQLEATLQRWRASSPTPEVDFGSPVEP
jgi:hypothetical protein